MASGRRSGLTRRRAKAATPLQRRAATALLHGREAALTAKDTAQATFASGGIGADLPTLDTDDDDVPIVTILIALGFADSKGEARRKIGEGAVRVNGEVVQDPQAVVPTAAEPVKISLGKKKHGLLTRS